MAAACDLIVATAQKKGGRLWIRNRRSFDEQVAKLDERWELEVTVTRLRATRSPQANRFYWGVVIEALSQHTGYTPEEMHDLCKAQFLPKKLAVCDGNGEVVGEYVLGGSTRQLKTNEFYEYVERVRQWAAELDCYIPDPSEAF